MLSLPTSGVRSPFMYRFPVCQWLLSSLPCWSRALPSFFLSLHIVYWIFMLLHMKKVPVLALRHVNCVQFSWSIAHEALFASFPFFWSTLREHTACIGTFLGLQLSSTCSHWHCCSVAFRIAFSFPCKFLLGSVSCPFNYAPYFYSFWSLPDSSNNLYFACLLSQSCQAASSCKEVPNSL